MTVRDTSADTDRKRWPALLVCLAGGFIVFLDVSIVNVALPMISVHLHASGSAGLLQTGQRIGASIGIAAAGAAFFTTLRGHGSFAHAYQNGIVVTSAITAAALLLALIDRRRATSRGRQRSRDRHPAKLLAPRMAPNADRGGRPARRQPRSACPASTADAIPSRSPKRKDHP